jgi:hypothetical protein
VAWRQCDHQYGTVRVALPCNLGTRGRGAVLVSPAEQRNTGRVDGPPRSIKAPPSLVSAH